MRYRCRNLLCRTSPRLVNFPQHATPGEVAPAVLYHLGVAFVPLVITFAAIAITVLMFYDIDRSKHQMNLDQLHSECDSGVEADAHAHHPELQPARGVS
jgi:hypothetical protein